MTIKTIKEYSHALSKMEKRLVDELNAYYKQHNDQTVASVPDTDPYFQIRVITEICDALYCLIELIEKNQLQNRIKNPINLEINTATSIQEIINDIMSNKEAQTLLKVTIPIVQYYAIFLFAAIAVWSLFYLLPALLAAEFTLLVVFQAVIVLICCLSILESLEQNAKLNHSLALLERAHRESNPRVDFSEEFVNKYDQKIPCQKSIYELAAGFFKAEENCSSLAEQTFMTYQNKDRSFSYFSRQS